MTRAARWTAAVALVSALAACGGSADTAGNKASPSSGSASPSPSASAPAACPITAAVGQVPAGVSADLTVKPVVPANPAPAPTEVTVADVVVGTGAEVGTLDSVEAKYVGTLYDTGVEFDSSWKTSPDKTFSFNACSSGTVPGFAVAPMGMKQGGRRVVTIPALYGYQNQAQGGIPANAVLVFVIDLVKVTPRTG